MWSMSCGRVNLDVIQTDWMFIFPRYVTFLMKRGVEKTQTRSNAVEIVKTRLRVLSIPPFHQEGHIFNGVADPS